MNQKHLKRVQLQDRIARRVITTGGIAVIFSVILILFLIARVTFPLFQDPSAKSVGQFTLEDPASALATGIDEYLEDAFVLGRDGSIQFFHPVQGDLIERVELEAPAAGAAVVEIEKMDPVNYHLLWSDGSSTVEGIRFLPS